MLFVRPILRSLVISLISVYLAQTLIGGFFFGLDGQQTFALVIVTLVIIHVFLIPLLKILGMPSRGFLLLILNIILISIIFYILPMFLAGFSIVETELAQLRIFGFVIPSRHLSSIEATLALAIVTGVTYHFLEWLCEKR